MTVSKNWMLLSMSRRRTLRNRFAFMKIFKILLIACWALFSASVFAQSDFRSLSPQEAASVLSGFRNYRMAGDFVMKFNITHYLRKGDDTETYTGAMYGTWDANGPILRIEIAHAGIPATKKSFLLRGGKAPELWTLNAEKQVVRVDNSSTEPFFENLIFTPFDLQTPFVYWENAKYERTKRFRGRPVHFFRMYPPESFKSVNAEIAAVRIGFDRVYNALVSAEVIGTDNKPRKTFSLSRVQKIGEQYTIRELELRDDVTRDKDEFVVYAAAMGLRLSPTMFNPEALKNPPPVLPASMFKTL